jgi:RecA-family ATPase
MGQLISAKQLVKMKIPKQKWWVEHMLMENSINYISGIGGSYKTTLALYIAWCGALGKDVLGFKVGEKFTTLIIDEESGIIKTKMKFESMMKGCEFDIGKIDDDAIKFSCMKEFKFDAESVNALDKLLEYRRFDLVVIDNVTRCTQDDKDENASKDVANVFKHLKLLCEKYHTTFLIIHHNNKSGTNNMESLAGSRDYGNQADTVLNIMCVGHHANTKTACLKQTKNRFEIEFAPINFTATAVNEGGMLISYCGTVSENMVKKIEVALMNLMKVGEIYESSFLVKKMEEEKFKSSSVYTALKNLETANIIKEIGNEKDRNFQLVESPKNTCSKRSKKGMEYQQQEKDE